MNNEVYKKVYDILFDEGENEPLTLSNNDGKTVKFEQIFSVERGDALYCILRPLTDIKGLSRHSVLVFSVDRDGHFHAVKEKQIFDSVLAEYHSMIFPFEE